MLDNMGFSATRKRLIHSHDCLSTSNFDKDEENNPSKTFNFEAGSSSDEL